MKKLNKIFLIFGILSLVLFGGCMSAPIGNTDADGNLNVTVVNPTYENEALIEIDWTHFKAHEGKHFYLRDYYTLGNGATRNIVIYTGDMEAHLLPTITANDGAINVSMFENPTIASNGTEIVYYNSNYNYGDLNGLTIYNGATVSNLGDFKGRSYIGSGRSFGGVIRAENEIILKANTTYVFQITNQITTDNIIDVVLDWYEDD